MLAQVTRAIETIASGGMVVMVDDEDRENEGDLVLAADTVTPQHINFMAKHARGLICLTLEGEAVDRLNLPMMADPNKSIPSQETAFTVSIEARKGVTTGISAADRSHTIKVAVDPKTRPEDIVVPGHIFPLRARAGGVLERAGHTEGSVDIAKLAGFSGAGVICEIMNDDGTMARMSDLEDFAKQHDLPIVAIADLIQYRLLKESMVEVLRDEIIMTKGGRFRAVVFQNTVDNSEHLAIVKGENFGEKIVDVRVHNQKILADVFGESLPGSPGERIAYGMEMLSKVDNGVLVYLSQPNPSMAQELASFCGDAPTEPASPQGMDVRQHGTGAQIIRHLGVKKMRVHTTSPLALKGLSGFGLEIVEEQLFQK